MGRGVPRRVLRVPQLLGALRDHDVDFVVIGGVALAPHGYIRATKDLDIVPAPTSRNLSRLAAALRALEAEADLGDTGADEPPVRLSARALAEGGNWVLADPVRRT